MARIAGVNIPDSKPLHTALTYIYGIGRSSAARIIKDAHLEGTKRAVTLTAAEISKLRDVIEKSFKVEGELRREILMNIKRLKDTNTYRGLRHIKGLPVRGQRTKTNSRTRRGNVRRTMGSGKRTAEKK